MKLLEFDKTIELLEKYNIPIPWTRKIKSEKDLKGLRKTKQFPFVLKAFSPNLLHRTEKGLVFKDIQNENDLREKFNIIKRNNALKKGVILIQEQIKGLEFVSGMKRDKVFGPALLFGMGGIFVEILKDVSWSIAPINLSEAKKMINSIKAKKILKGYRNTEKINIKKLAEIIVNISNLSMKEKTIKEIDFNPIIA
ncbi:MAG TPA: acetate--CoA ligase family protein, partial [Patescibacteria group bacterium]|nr:acetate--CoA ligase family protein [Patescibacteria group bacterium]